MKKLLILLLLVPSLVQAYTVILQNALTGQKNEYFHYANLA